MWSYSTPPEFSQQQFGLKRFFPGFGSSIFSTYTRDKLTRARFAVTTSKKTIFTYFVYVQTLRTIRKKARTSAFSPIEEEKEA